jgi:hypothetical protein
LLEFFEDDRVELYDLERDPGETWNLAPEMPEQVSALRVRAEAWRTELRAPVPREKNPAYRPQKPLPEGE